MQFSGGFCHHCHATAKDCVNSDIVRNGFPFSPDIADMIELYENLTGNRADVDISLLVKSSERREGLTITLQSMKRIPPLHSYINSLKWFEKTNYSLNARMFNESGDIPVIGRGKKKHQDDKYALERSKDYFGNLAKNGQLNSPLDQPGFFHLSHCGLAHCSTS